MVSTEQQPAHAVLGGWLRGQRQAAGWSLRGLADHAGVSSPYLSQIERGHRSPSIEILRAIARSLGLPMEAVYVRAGLLEPRDPADVEAAIAQDPQLDVDQQHRLIATYRSMRTRASVADR